jgi:hypothetical protein
VYVGLGMWGTWRGFGRLGRTVEMVGWVQEGALPGQEPKVWPHVGFL